MRDLASRTSESLNEGLSIKMARKKVKRKRLFFHRKDSRFNNCLSIEKIVGFAFHTSYKSGKIGQGGGCQNAQKQFIIKTY